MIKSFFRKYNYVILFCVSIALWIFCFRGFFLQELNLTSDANSYHDHINFFVDYLSRGQFPIWNPVWNSGVPNEFFLRRFNGFNPFYSLIVIFRWMGFSNLSAYFSFLGLYYILTCVGFYFLAKEIFKKRELAFVAYLLLLHSSLGTRLFDSYLILPFAPMVWLFFFLLSFNRHPSRLSVLGMVFSVMLILNTYIPFYFLTIFLTFLIFICLFYWRGVWAFLEKAFQFFCQNKGFFCIVFLLLLLAPLPSVRMYLDAKAGEFAMPSRSYQTESDMPLAVAAKTVESWGILEDLVYSSAFTDLRRFKFAIFYIPMFGYLLLFLSLATRVTKRGLFFLLWGCLLFLICSPHAPFYPFLYEKVFYYKLFRNLHFFLWWGLLPILILFMVDRFQELVNFKNYSKNFRKIFLFIILLLHGAVLIWMIRVDVPIVSSYITLLLSCVFFVYLFSKEKAVSVDTLLLILLCVISIQPLEVYTYLNANARRGMPEADYTEDHYNFVYQYRRFVKPANDDQKKDEYGFPVSSNEAVYYGTRWYNQAFEHINSNVLKNYIYNRFYIYDYTESINKEAPDYKQIERSMHHKKNIAYIDSLDDKEIKMPPSGDRSQAFVPTQDFEQLKVLEYGANGIKFQTHFTKDKFLVYSDSYHSEWTAYIDGQEKPILRSNISFKGIWVPAGEHIIEFRFGSISRQVINYTMLISFYFVFGFLLFLLSKKDNHLVYSEENNA